MFKEWKGNKLMTRSEAREVLMHILFQMDAQDDCSDELRDLFLSGKTIPQQHQEYINTIFALVKEHLNELDDRINRNSDKWATTRMPKTDLAVLRLATAEIVYAADIPAAVAIDEAVEMSKKYGSDSSHKFVNGVLGKIAKEVSYSNES
jgi:transcription antitermination protein NusB